MNYKVILCSVGLCAVLAGGVGYTALHGGENTAAVAAVQEETAATYKHTSRTTSAIAPAKTAEWSVITLSDCGCIVEGGGAVAEGSNVFIQQGGKYRICGSVADGSVVVNAGNADVTLELAGADITCLTDPALDIEKAGAITVCLAENSDNRLTSGVEASIEAAMKSNEDAEDATGGALYAHDTLTLTGEGTLTVNGWLNNGIQSRTELNVEGGTLYVTAVNHALKGKEQVNIKNGTMTLRAGKDGIHGANVVVDGGKITANVEDDGLHADETLTVNAGSIAVEKSCEGMEATRLTINGGEISVTSSDDGFNASGGYSGGFAPRQTAAMIENLPELSINGGSVYVNAAGDGLDSNGNLTINGGLVVVDGPSNSGNGALDCGTENGGALTVNGGTVLAIGANGMAEGFESSSGQVSFHLGVSFNAGDAIEILDAAGETLYSHTAAKQGGSIVFSSPKLKVGETITVQVNGTATELTLTDTVTTGGVVGGFGGFGRGERPDGTFGRGERPVDGTPPENFKGGFGRGGRPTDGTPPEDFKGGINRGERPTDGAAPDGNFDGFGDFADPEPPPEDADGQRPEPPNDWNTSTL